MSQLAIKLQILELARLEAVATARDVHEAVGRWWAHALLNEAQYLLSKRSAPEFAAITKREFCISRSKVNPHGIRYRLLGKRARHYCRVRVQDGLIRDIGHINNPLWAFSTEIMGDVVSTSTQALETIEESRLRTADGMRRPGTTDE